MLGEKLRGIAITAGVAKMEEESLRKDSLKLICYNIIGSDKFESILSESARDLKFSVEMSYDFLASNFPDEISQCQTMRNFILCLQNLNYKTVNGLYFIATDSYLLVSWYKENLC